MKVKVDANQSVIGSEYPGCPGYRLVEARRGYRLYKKWNPILRIGSYMEIDDAEKIVKVGKVQDVEAIIEQNKAEQSNFSGYGSKLMVRTSNVPIVVDQQLKAECGLNIHTGEYDETKYNRILNDGDYKYLKTVPGRI